MLTLSAKVIDSTLSHSEMFSLSELRNIPHVLRAQKAFLVRNSDPLPEGFAHYFIVGDIDVNIPAGVGVTHLKVAFDYLGEDDIVRVLKDGSVRALFRASSWHNSVLLTEQCNNYCLMCSQPPKKHDDSWIIKDVCRMIPMLPRHVASLGITGGEPTVFGDEFLDVLRLCKSWLPYTSMHVLSNGRSFSDPKFAEKYAAIEHPDIMVGIPIYSDDPARHDYVVQAKGAFDETIRGILNLKRLGQKVEIRVVIHKQTIERLPELAEFIARNLLFVDQVALMGLEMTGFTRANLDALWIDPYEYRDILSEAVAILTSYKINVSVYNHQLCVLNPDVYPYCVKSISDWKNDYADECANCSKMTECGGFFSSCIQFGYSKHIHPFAD
jgi:His-Xaa-Ser system radical SAM maturase HxsC